MSGEYRELQVNWKMLMIWDQYGWISEKLRLIQRVIISTQEFPEDMYALAKWTSNKATFSWYIRGPVKEDSNKGKRSKPEGALKEMRSTKSHIGTVRPRGGVNEPVGSVNSVFMRFSTTNFPGSVSENCNFVLIFFEISPVSGGSAPRTSYAATHLISLPLVDLDHLRNKFMRALM